MYVFYRRVSEVGKMFAPDSSTSLFLLSSPLRETNGDCAMNITTL